MALSKNKPRAERAITVPDVIDTVSGLESAAAALAAGTGAFAIDTERAMAFRYDDRCFLLQVRRADTETFLIAPEGMRSEVREILSPVLGGHEWILHAAASDLPSLGWLGLHPGSLFDTELAGRLANLEHVNLAAMVNDLLGVYLAKSHGAQDWSRTPLPESWRKYAALDVEHLFELRKALTQLLDEEGKLSWAQEEFAYVIDRYGGQEAPPPPSWQDLKGISKLKHPAALNIARELWLARETIAAESDISPAKVLPAHVLISIARTPPRTISDMARVKGLPKNRRSAPTMWQAVVDRARKAPVDSFPKRPARSGGLPARQRIEHRYPEEFELLLDLEDLLLDLSEEVNLPFENLLPPRIVRQVLWDAAIAKELTSANDLPGYLRSHEVRQWQIQLTAPLMTEVLFPEQT